ncbi:MAG TPA: hypothetical protein VGS22_01605 [Thermoanaerobaculia bacterium]|nr:hypothetical protein [Thermoanaerobaculia bacterium]
MELPDLSRTDCYYLEACGKPVGVVAQKKSLRTQKIARVRLSGANAYLRLVEGGVPPGHFHIDLALTRLFPSVRPDVNSNRSTIISDISLHLGQEYDVLIFAQFITMAKDIPADSGVVFGGVSAVVSTVNKATIEVGGAHLILRNDPFVQTIDWQLYRGDAVFVDITARCKATVSLSYLTDITGRLMASYETFILGRSLGATS